MRRKSNLRFSCVRLNRSILTTLTVVSGLVEPASWSAGERQQMIQCSRALNNSIQPLNLTSIRLSLLGRSLLIRSRTFNRWLPNLPTIHNRDATQKNTVVIVGGFYF